jgi:hypothetical protein
MLRGLMSIPVEPAGRCRVEARPAGVEDWSADGCVLGGQPADNPCSVAMEERLKAAQVVGDVDPVVGLDRGSSP